MCVCVCVCVIVSARGSVCEQGSVYKCVCTFVCVCVAHAFLLCKLCAFSHSCVLLRKPCACVHVRVCLSV
jgi:hypothetical protein